MKVSAKLNAAFSLAAVFLIAVSVAAICVVGRLNDIHDDTNRYNTQAGQVAEAQRAYRLAPQRLADHLARLDDLKRWARSDDEIQLITTAQQQLTAKPVAASPIDHLEQLGALYRSKTAAAQQQQLTLQRWTTYGLIVVMVDSVLIFIILGWFVRRWVLTPLRIIAGGIEEINAGNPQRKISPIGDEEFTSIANGINQLGAELHLLRETGERNQRLSNMGEACSHVTHNVRSLLGSIRSLAQYESNASDVDPDSRVGFNYIIALVNKLDQWVRDLHSTVSPINPRVTATQLEPIIHDAIALLEPRVSEKQLQIDYRADDDVPRAVVDRGLFEQAFLAVFSNAVQAAPADSRVGVQLSNGTTDRVTLVIEDNGAGMTDEVRQRAFDPYFTTKPEAAGLGLTIAQSIMKKHGGEIEIESAPTKGTRVALHFPAAKKS